MVQALSNYFRKDGYMKKHTKNRLMHLSSETIRRLGEAELGQAVGGGFPGTEVSCKYTCEPDCLDPPK